MKRSIPELNLLKIDVPLLDTFYKDLSVYRLPGLHESRTEIKILLTCVVCKKRSFLESLFETWDYPRVVLFFKTPTEFDLAEYSLGMY